MGFLVVVNDNKGPASQYGNRKVHIAGVRAGGKLRLFVDGRLVGTEALDGKLFTRPDQILRIGPADGVIDEVRVSKVARYDKDFTPAARFEPDADTLALYHFDEGSGDVLKDSSGNNHHGKIVGATWVNADGSPIAAPSVPLDYALRFTDGTQVEVPSLKLAQTGPVTFEGYFTVLKSRPDKAGDIMVVDRQIGLYFSDKGWHFAVTGIRKKGEDFPAHIKKKGEIAQRVHMAAIRTDKEIRL